MILKIVEFSLRQRALVLFAALLLVGVGVWSALRLPIDAVPDITSPQVLVNTGVSALAPEEIEKLITYPIEVEMSGIERLSEVRSISKFGLSQVVVTFAEGADIETARNQVTQRLATVERARCSAMKPSGRSSRLGSRSSRDAITGTRRA